MGNCSYVIRHVRYCRHALLTTGLQKPSIFFAFQLALGSSVARAPSSQGEVIRRGNNLPLGERMSRISLKYPVCLSTLSIF